MRFESDGSLITFESLRESMSLSDGSINGRDKAGIPELDIGCRCKVG